jgi:hypothetical protein
MAAFDPSAPPFWASRSGGGVVEKQRQAWQQSIEIALDAQQEKKLRLLDPRVVTREEYRELVGMKRLPISSRTYQERRDLGLCTVCENPTEFARCDQCRLAYNARHAERMSKYRERRKLKRADKRKAKR